MRTRNTMAHAKVIYLSGEIPQGDPEGDQRILFRKLHLLSKERNYPILASTLEAITSSLKQECRRLERAQRDLVPTFESVLDLTDSVVALRKTPLGGAIERVLVLVFQLGIFIAHHEANPLEYKFRSENTVLLGRGPGLLSGAAIALSPTPLLLPIVAAEITKITFRFGLIVDQVCRSSEVSPDEINADGAWVYCAHGAGHKDAEEAVAQFNAKKAYPQASMATVFNADDLSVSIGGPPSTLKCLFSESDFFKKTKNVPMRKVQGTWHNAKTYGAEHVKEIFEGITLSSHLCFPIFSPVTGRPLESTEGVAVLTELMTEILTQSIRWDQTIDGVSDHLKRLSPNELQLWSLQPSHYMASVLDRWSAELPTASMSHEIMMPTVMGLNLGQSSPRDAKSAKIAVVGMACRFPGGANDTEKFWELLAQGRDVHAPVPPDRFDAASHVDATEQKPNTSKTPYGCFVDDPGLFDAFFFGMSPREAEQTDPMQRLALVTAYEALESSGYVNGRGIHQRRVGTFYGCASDDYREVNSGQDIGTYFISGGCRAFGPGRINYFLKFWGPSYSIDTACSSSLAAIQAACTSLWSGDIDMAITGGMNIITNSDVYAGLSRGHFLSPTGGCKTWDEGADGYCRADGVGSVVLKRLEDAEADNDNILAVVLAAGTDHSAEAVSITHPHDLAQAHLYNQMVKRAGIDPLSVGYVEFHGTGTGAGDPTEMRSVTSVFAPGQPRNTSLHIGSVKANVGHGEAAAGIMSFIKTVLVFDKGVIPPHVGIKTALNPALPKDLDKRGVIIPFTATPWERSSEQKRLAMVNNFGAAGGNTAMILEEATARPRVGEDSRPTHPITISAKTPHSLEQNLRRLVAYVEARPNLSIADLSYTLSARKMHYNYRVSMLVTSCQEAVKRLHESIETTASQLPTPSKQPTVAFAFTGQGTFYVGIGAQLYKDSRSFQQHLDRLDGIARRQKFPSFLPVIKGTCNVKDVPTISMHLAIVCVEIALTKLWASYGVTPSVVIGHSLGEYAALNAAGVFSDTDTIFLVGTRAMLLETICTPATHGMLSVRASLEAIQTAANGAPFEVACINGPQETVVGGAVADLDALATVLGKAGYRTFKLDVPHAYHTSQMEALLDDFVKLTQAVVPKRPKIPVFSPRCSQVLTSDIDVAYLAKATRETVDYVGGLHAARQTGVIAESSVWVEVGHHPCCVSFIAKTLSDTRLTCPTLHRDKNNWTTVGETLVALYNAGVSVDWSEYHLPFEPALRLVDTPTYAWNNKNYWIQYTGDWNLTKGQALSDPSLSATTIQTVKGFRTTSIHNIRSESYTESSGQLLAESDMTDPALKDVIEGHAMNDYGVASSFLHADMAFTVAKRILDKGIPASSNIGINVADFEYHEPVVKHYNPTEAQPIVVSAEADLQKGQAHIKWYNPDKDLWYCHASVFYEDPSSWLLTWSRSVGLVTSRIADLYDLAANGKADKLTTNLAYSLFGKLVGYSDMYRTMKSVILNRDEAVAEVEFPSDTAGSWTVPPHFIDGCVSLSGFILNGGTHFDNTKYFYITPSWKSMKFAKPLTPGGRYLAYVRMIPAGKNDFVGDVYILQNDEIVGVVEAIVFKQWPRVMLSRFFSPPTTKDSARVAVPPQSVAPPSSMISGGNTSKMHSNQPSLFIGDSKVVSGLLTPPSPAPSIETQEIKQKQPTLVTGDSGSTDRAFGIIAEELAVDVRMLTDDANVADFGLDSLMSLVLSQRLREELKTEIRDAFFLEVSTFGDLKKMLG
ncbi:beta-ketoacyl synthase domain-containing protein [Paraphaeosphaeria sporulosa]